MCFTERVGGGGGGGAEEGEEEELEEEKERHFFFFGFGFCWFALPMLALAYSKKRRLDIKGRD